MRLNIRLTGWIFGLVIISILGEIFLRSAAWQSGGRRSGKGNPAAIFVVLGLGLLVIGFVSRIFAQLVQAAISRNRERLADASATQFTRNPEALANALSRIGGDALGSKINSPRAGEFAHFFFANGVNALFATHPPLEERIRALNPRWDGKFLPPLSRGNADDAENTAVVPEPMPRGNASALPAIFTTLSGNADDAKALIYMLTMAESPECNVAQARILLSRESSALFKKWNRFGAKSKNPERVANRRRSASDGRVARTFRAGTPSISRNVAAFDCRRQSTFARRISHLGNGRTRSAHGVNVPARASGKKRRSTFRSRSDKLCA